MSADESSDDRASADPGDLDPAAASLSSLAYVSEGLALTDIAGVITTASPAASVALDCPIQFLKGKPLGLMFTAETRPRFYQALIRLGNGIAADTFDVGIARRHAGLRQLVVTGLVKSLGPRTGEGSLAWIIQDVTQTREIEGLRRELLTRLVSAQEEERRRVARELHDSLGQLLAAMGMSIKSAQHRLPENSPVAPDLIRLAELTDRVSREMHAMAVRLRPTALDDLGLDAALRQLVTEWSQTFGIACEYQAFGQMARLAPLIETVVYRLVQEALTNVARHSQATQASVILGKDGKQMRIVVEDNGRGFDASALRGNKRQRLGLLGLRERIALVNGTLQIESTPGDGTTLIASVPVE